LWCWSVGKEGLDSDWPKQRAGATYIAPDAHPGKYRVTELALRDSARTE